MIMSLRFVIHAHYVRHRHMHMSKSAIIIVAYHYAVIYSLFMDKDEGMAKWFTILDPVVTL